MKNMYDAEIKIQLTSYCGVRAHGSGGQISMILGIICINADISHRNVTKIEGRNLVRLS